MILRRFFSFLVVLGTCLFALSCSSNKGQNEFEKESLRTPNGYTHTDTQGQVVNNETDPDDWRIGPMFQGYVYVQSPAYPNPVKASPAVRIELMITGIQAVNGLYLYRRSVDGSYKLLASQPQSPMPSGLAVLQFNSSQLSENGTYSGAIGLHRVFVYDENFNLITYGDVKVE